MKAFYTYYTSQFPKHCQSCENLLFLDYLYHPAQKPTALSEVINCLWHTGSLTQHLDYLSLCKDSHINIKIKGHKLTIVSI